ncbi:MAG TPA: hypothetical protein PLC42_01150 [Parachlamydiaceae bacterium]|nr:hypothetical protein [Parachlamydiaceae bacterium]
MENVPNPVTQAPTAAAAAAAPVSAAKAEAAMSMHASAEATGSTKFSSLDDLKRKAPKVYHQMMVGVATSIIADMRDHQERLKKLREQGRQNA